MENEQNTNKHYISLSMVLLFVTLSVAFLQIGTVFTFPLVVMWIALAAGKLVANLPVVRSKYPLEVVRKKLTSWGVQTENHRRQNSVLGTFLTWNFGSQVAIWLYTILLVVFGMTESRFLSSNIMTFVNGLSAVSILYLFGRRGVNVSIAALCMAWFISLVRAFVAPAFEDFWKNLELHDIAFGAGYILLYYVFCHKKWDLFHASACGVVALLILLAFKRIGLAALALTVILWAVLRYVKKETARRKILFWGSTVAIVLCYLFVVMIVEGWLIAILNAMGIHPMGRNYYYEALSEHCEISLWFPGLGRNASATLFTTDYAYMRVGNVHSDILRMYAECGFVLFGLWLLVFWVFLPKAIDKKYGYRAMEFFLLCTVYTFIIYATDNTELYLVNQYFYMLIPMHVILLNDHRPNGPECMLAVWYEKLGMWLATRKAAKAASREEESSEDVLFNGSDTVEQ